MGYRTLRECLDDLAAHGQLVTIDQEVDPHLEAAAIHRRVFAAGGPAVYFARVKGTPFPMVSNLFGTRQRVQWMFRDTLPAVSRLVRLKADPSDWKRRPGEWFSLLRTALNMRPKFVRRGAVLAQRTRLDQLPQLVCWPRDGGPFITLPLVYSEDARRPGIERSNLGMYRIQMGGGQYRPNAEAGLHYQIHRGIGVHQAAAIEAGIPLRVHVHVGGPPAWSMAAVMPLPEGFSELYFAGALGGRRLRLVRGVEPLPVFAEADFCITGTVHPTKRLPEGPFGDHLGYYSLEHDFPVLQVERVYHRRGAIWPFTVVGRPPQEDTQFGEFIHELTGPAIPAVVHGVHAVHAVDAAGVHPLLLAVGSERYAPFAPLQRPMELLTQANAILGQGQMSLAKYLLIVNRGDDRSLDIHDIPAFFMHLLRRIDWTRDAHFQTCTTIDTLDYTGGRLNEGSKVVWAAVGRPRRELPAAIEGPLNLPEGFADPRVCLPGVLAVAGPKYRDEAFGAASRRRFCEAFTAADPINRFPLIVLADDSSFTAAALNNFLWVTFTRSNPAADIDGIEAFTQEKHWGCRGSLVIDARSKPHHAPPLEEDPAVVRRVEALAAPGGPLHGIL